MISILCAQCGKTYRVQESTVGKRVKCKCGFSFTISPPNPSENPSPQTGSHAPPPLPPKAELNELTGSSPTGRETSAKDQSAEHHRVATIKIDNDSADTKPTGGISIASSPRSVLQNRPRHSLNSLWLWGGGVLTVALILILVVLFRPPAKPDDRSADSRHTENRDTAKQTVTNENAVKKKAITDSSSDDRSDPQKPKQPASATPDSVPQDSRPSEQPRNLSPSGKEPPIGQPTVTDLFEPDLDTEVILPDWNLTDLELEEALARHAGAESAEKEKLEEILIRGGSQSVPLLIEAIRKSDSDRAAPYSLFGICGILSRIGQPALQPLLDIANDAKLQDKTRDNALQAIGDMGPLASPAVPDLAKIFHSSPIGLLRGPKLSAANAISRIGVMTDEAQSVLIDILENRSSKYPSNYLTVALNAAQSMGPSAAPLVDSIRPHLLTQKNESREAAKALAAIGPRAGASAIEFSELIERNDRVVTFEAFHAIRDIGPSAAAAIPALLKRLQSSANKFERGNVAEALGRMGPAATEALPILEDYLKQAEQEDFQQGQRVIYRLAISRIRENPSEAIPYLRNALTDNTHNARSEAIRQIGTLGSDGHQLIPDLADLIINLDTKQSAVGLAIQAMGNLKEHGASGLGTLIQFINREHEKPDGQKTYRLHAIDAIAAIDSDDRVKRGLTRIAHHDSDRKARDKALRLLQRLQGNR